MNPNHPLAAATCPSATRATTRYLEVAAAVAILLFAAAVRLIGIESLPPGLFQDEAVNGVNVFTILAGHPQMYYGEREPLFMYSMALVSLALNPIPLALRVTAALYSVVGVASTGALARRLFGTWVGLLAAFGMASSVWLTVLGRTSLRANEVPAFEALGLAVIWRATETGRTREYAAGGAILGLSLYTYLAARFIPVLLIVFALACIILHRSWMIEKIRGFIVAAAAAIAVLLPLGYYAVRHPTIILGRPDQVALPGGSAFLPALFDSTVRTLGMIVVRGDVTWRHNFSNAPVFDPINAVLFFVGLTVAIRRHRPADLLIVTMLFTMLLPGMLSIDSPHFLRTIGATPALYALWAIGLVVVVRFIEARSRRLRIDPRRLGAVGVGVGAILIVALLGWSATRDVWSYFVAYARDPTMPGYYNVKLVEAGKVLAADPLWRTGRDNVYITDVYTDSIGSLAYWVYPRMTTEEKVNWVDESSLGTYFPQGEFIPLPMSPSLYLLSPDAPTTGVEEALGASIRQRRELSDGQHTLGRAIWADSVSFPDITVAEFGALALESASAVPDMTGSGQSDPGRWTLNLRWRVLRQPSYSPSVFVHVDDDRGHTIAQADQQLRLSLDHWKVGQRLVSIRSIVLPPGTLPGRYSISLGVYDKESGRRETVTVGDHPVVPPTVATIDLAAPVAGAASADVPIGAAVANGLSLVGAERWPATVEAGEKLPIALIWRSVGTIATDDEVTVSLRQSDGTLAGSASAPIGSPAYPTSRWSANTTVRQIVDLPVNPLATGSTTLMVRIGPAGATLERDSTTDLGPIVVSAAQHVFAAPAISRPVDYRFGDAGRLVGWYAPNTALPGEPILLTLIWLANTQSTTAYTVFVHLLDATGAIAGQRDEAPSHGARPTTGWVKNEYIVDPHEVDVPAATAPGSYRVEVGLYDPRSGQRVLVTPGTDSAVIGVVDLAPH